MGSWWAHTLFVLLAPGGAGVGAPAQGGTGPASKNQTGTSFFSYTKTEDLKQQILQQISQ